MSTENTEPASQTERIAKVIARAGLCSRREAEDWIAEGRVAVNGKVLTTPAVTVGPSDEITVDGRTLPTRERTRLWLYHKPRGLVTTTSDPEGRPTVFEALPADLPRVMTVGRLDINTEGLLLLTNDGGLARVLELPATGWLRKYRVRAYGHISQETLDSLKAGVAVDGMLYGPIEATVDNQQGDNCWLTLGLREGKNREVKRVLNHLGLQVNRLIRMSFGPFQLGEIPEGQVTEVRGKALRDQLGAKLALEAGVDFESPIVVKKPRDESENARPRKTGGQYARRDQNAAPAGRRDRDDRAPRGGRFGSEGRFENRVSEPARPRVLDPMSEGGAISEFKGRGPRSGPREERGDRGERGFGPRRDGDRPRFGNRDDRGPREDRGFRSGGDRPFRGPREDGGSDRPQREGFAPRGDGERRPRFDRGDRPEGDRPFRARPEGDRPFKSRGYRSHGGEGQDGERPQRARGTREVGETFTPRPRREDRGPGENRGPREDRGFRDDRGPREDRGFRSGGGDRPRFGNRDDRPPRETRGYDKPWKARPEGDDAQGGERPFRERGPRRDGDAPRDFKDRGFKDRGERNFGGGERGDRPFTPRPPRDGDRPRGPRPEGDKRSFGDRGDRGDRGFGGKERGDRPFSSRPPRDGDRPFSSRPPRDGDRPRGPRPEGEKRSFGDRGERGERNFGGGERGDRPFTPRPPRDGDRPRGPRPEGEKRPFGERKVFGGKPGGDRKPFDKRGGPGGGKPGPKRPGGGAPRRPGGPRPDRG